MGKTWLQRFAALESFRPKERLKLPGRCARVLLPLTIAASSIAI